MSRAKVTKASVDYSLGHSMGDHCGICKYFIKPDECEKVKGTVRSAMWCKLFKKKSK